VGVIIVPLALGLLLNSYGPLTSDSAIRMAFATVAGQSVAIGSALAVVVITLFRRRGLGEVALFVIIGVVITLGALNAMAEAGDMLLTRLDLVAQTNLLN